MRVNATLAALQKAMGDAVCKVVLGDDAYTYGVDTTNRILDLKHIEQEWSQTAQIVVDNREGNLTALDLEGYAGIISYGYVSTYSASAPLTVIAQKTDSMQGELVTTISLAGLFNMWAEQEATEAYSPDEINTDTVKTILDAIATPTMACFSTAPGDYPAHEISYDDDYDDGIINDFKPADAFSVAKGESRLSAFKKALAYTKCKCRVENDEGVATIHIFQHETTTHDYEYNDAIDPDNHNFFDKSVRKRLVLPNKVVVMNHPEHPIPRYSGSAVDTASYEALGEDKYYTKTVYCRPADDDQAALIAAGILLKYQLAAERGHGFAPMNCGQEYCDFVKITDSRADDTREGNIGYINRHYTPGKFEFEFRFGTLELLGLAGTVPPAMTKVTHVYEGLEGYQALVDMVSSLIDQNNAMREALLEAIAGVETLATYLHEQQWEGIFAKLDVYLRFQGPTGTDMWS